MHAEKKKFSILWAFLVIFVIAAVCLLIWLLKERSVRLNGQAMSTDAASEINGAAVTELSDAEATEKIQSTDEQENENSGVPILGRYFPSESEELDLTELACSAGCGAEISEALAQFPNLTCVDMANCGLPTEEAYAIVSAYPNIRFRWSFALCGEEHTSDEKALDVSGKVPKDEEVFLRTMQYFDKLESANLCDCGLSAEALAHLRETMPNTEFTWNCNLFGVNVSTGDTAVNLSYHTIKENELDTLRAAFVAFPELYSVDMCDCGLSNETMAAFRTEYSEREIFWRVYFGKWSSRTNATAFSTNINGKSPRCTSKDFAPLKYCTNLRSLDLGHMAVDDLSFMKDMTELRILILADNKVRDISLLSNFTKLEYVELFLNNITDITPLANLTNLIDLNLFACHITDLTPLYGLQNLERLWIANNFTMQKQRDELVRQLPNCYVNTDSVSATSNGWRDHSRYFDVLEIITTNIWHDWT